MGGNFPLLLPKGTVEALLPWEDDLCQGWIVNASTGGGNPTATWTFGKTAFGRHLCLHRFKLWWLKPSHGRSGLNVPPETALLLAERRPPPPPPDSPIGTVPPLEYVAMLPISDTHARASLHRAGDGAASTSSSSSSPSPSAGEGATPRTSSDAAAGDRDPSALAVSADTGDPATLLPEMLGVLLVATGPDPFRLVRRLVREATDRMRAQLLSAEDGTGYDRRSAAVDGGSGFGVSCGSESKAALAASFVDTFGWCTWDSFYTMVTPEGVLEGLSTLRQGGVRPRWVVLDDGWQSTTNDDALNTEQWDERLVALEANKRFRRFDEEGRLLLDLGDTVAKMKRDFGVDQVLAWHAMAGYWAGVEPEAPEMAPFEPRVTKLLAPRGIREVDPEMQPELDEKRFGMVSPGRVEAFYLAYHKYLRDNGVDGVKVDAQSILDCMGGVNGGVSAVTRAFHQGLCRSVQATFKKGDRPAAVIHCMCHAPSVLFHIACVTQDRVVIRGSDDFYPREETSHGAHLYSNAFNALLLSNLGVQDWDMFQTGLGLEEGTGEAQPDVEGLGARASWFHAAARAISGGPVYVSDRPGQHNSDILSKLVLEDGSVLRASTNAVPTLDCLLRDPQQDGGGLLQVWAINPLAGTGVVGSFNVQGASFSQAERTWVRHRGDDHGGASPGVNGTVSPSDVHAFLMASHRPAAAAAAGGTGPSDGVDETLQDEQPPPDRFFAVYLHGRREARVVGLHEVVEIEVLPLGYELATFSRVVLLPLPLPLSSPGALPGPGGISEGERPAAAAAAAAGPDGQSRVGAARDRPWVRWAALGLSNMFNSSAAVTSQEVTTCASIASRRAVSTPEDEAGVAPSRGENRIGGGGGSPEGRSGGTKAGVSLTVKGSGTFLAVASRKPTLARLFCGAGEGEASDRDGKGGGDAGVLEVSFSALSGDDSTTAPEGGTRMGLVEVEIPGPWDGRERRLVFWWDV